MKDVDREAVIPAAPASGNQVTVEIECPSCLATGVYTDSRWCDGTGVVCAYCKGSGKKELTFTPFVRRKQRTDITTVFAYDATGTGPYVHDESTSKDGTVTYEEFLSGKMPQKPTAK